jgi:hypothetical protein
MKTTNSKNKKYMITSTHDVFVDDYFDGEGNNVNFYQLNSVVYGKDIYSAIQEYFEDVLHYQFNINNADINCGYLHYSVLVDADNCQADKSDIEVWKKKGRELYANNITIKAEEIKPIIITKKTNKNGRK